MSLPEPERMHTSSFARGGSSSRRAVISSTRPSVSTEAGDAGRQLASKMGPIRLTSAMQRGSPVTSTEPKRTVSHRQLPTLKSLEGALNEVDGQSAPVEESDK
jgi:hypothetical protein